MSSPTDALRLSRAPVWLCGVDTRSHLVATDLEAWITVEVSLTSGVDVRHCHAAALGRLRERAGQQKGCQRRGNREKMKIMLRNRCCRMLTPQPVTAASSTVNKCCYSYETFLSSLKTTTLWILAVSSVGNPTEQFTKP